MMDEACKRLQKKKRNLEKKKNKIEELKQKAGEGCHLNAEQKESLASYSAVLAQIELVNELLSYFEADATKVTTGKTNGATPSTVCDISEKKILTTFRDFTTQTDCSDNVCDYFILHDRFIRVLQCFGTEEVRRFVEKKKDPQLSMLELNELDELCAILLPNASCDRLQLDERLVGKTYNSYMALAETTCVYWYNVLSGCDDLLTEDLTGNMAYNLLEKFGTSSLFHNWSFPDWKNDQKFDRTISVEGSDLPGSIREQTIVASLVNQGPYSFFQPIEKQRQEESSRAADSRPENDLPVSAQTLYDKYPEYEVNVIHHTATAGMKILTLDNPNAVAYTSEAERPSQNSEVKSLRTPERNDWGSIAGIQLCQQLPDQEKTIPSAETISPRQAIEGAKSWAAVVGPGGVHSENDDVFSRAGLWKNPEAGQNAVGSVGEQKSRKGQYNSRGHIKASGPSRVGYQASKGRGNKSFNRAHQQ